jgi:hypothetical protein
LEVLLVDVEHIVDELELEQNTKIVVVVAEDEQFEFDDYEDL